MTWALIVRWIIKNWRMVLWLGFAGLFAMLSLYAQAEHRKVIIITNARASDLAAWNVKANGYKQAIIQRDAVIASYQEQEAQYVAATKANRDALAKAQADSASAQAEFQRLQAIADKSNAGWSKAYSQRPDSCHAALAALATACPTIKEY